MGCQVLGTPVTGTLEESYCCPTSAHRPPSWLAPNHSCVDPVLSVPDSSAPSPPGPSGSGLFAGEFLPVLGPTRVGPFSFWGCASSFPKRVTGSAQSTPQIPLSSSAKAGDPVSRGGEIYRWFPRHTGSPDQVGRRQLG